MLFAVINTVQNIFSVSKIFPVLQQNSLCFPCLEKVRTKFPVFPVPWPPCTMNVAEQFEKIQVKFSRIVNTMSMTFALKICFDSPKRVFWTGYLKNTTRTISGSSFILQIYSIIISLFVRQELRSQLIESIQ